MILNIIKITLFFVNYNKKLNFFEKKRTYLFAQLVIKKVITLKKIYDNISKMQKKINQVLKQKTKNNILTKEEK